MDFDTYREYPVLGPIVFSKPTGGLYGWAFFSVSVSYTLWTLVDRGYNVGLLAGGGLLLLSIPQVLPERHYRLAVVLRIIGIVHYIALWAAILLFFPDAPTFFQGNW